MKSSLRLLFRGDFDFDFILDFFLNDIVLGFPSLDGDESECDDEDDDDEDDDDPFGGLAGGSFADFDRWRLTLPLRFERLLDLQLDLVVDCDLPMGGGGVRNLFPAEMEMGIGDGALISLHLSSLCS